MTKKNVFPVIIGLFIMCVHAQPDTLLRQPFDFRLPSEFGSILSALETQEDSIPLQAVAAIGYDSLACRLYVFFRDSTGHARQRAFPLTTEGYHRLVQPPVSQAMGPIANKKGLRQEGRVYFITHTTLKSLYVYPAGITEIFPHLDGQVAAGLTLLAGSSSLYGAYAFTKKRPLDYGRVTLMNYGGELGCIYPILTGALLRNGTSIDRPRIRRNTLGEPEIGMDYGGNISRKITAIGSMVGFPLGLYAGSRVNLAGLDSYGKTAFARDLSRFGFLYGYLLPLYGDNGNEEDYFAVASGLTMVFLPAGFYLGMKIAEHREISAGRSFMVLTTGVMGSLTGLFLPTLFEKPIFGFDRRLYITTTLAGHAVGTGFGLFFKSSERYSFGQGVFTALSAAGGAAIAISFPLIAQSDDSQLYTGLAMIGGWGGFYVGEKLSRSFFNESSSDGPSLSHVTFPVLWQWPLLLAATGTGLRNGQTVSPLCVEMVRYSF